MDKDYTNIKNKQKMPFLYLEVTRRCNLKCPHCFNDSISNYKEELSNNDIKKIIDNFLKSGGKSIQFTGGEVFMREDIIDIVSYARESGIENILVSTNGTFSNESQINELADIVDEFFLSIDGFETEHDILRGKGSFQKTTKTLELLAAKNKYINIYLSLTPKVFNYLDEYIEWLIKNGVSFLNISPIGQVGRAKNIDNNLLFNKSNYIEIYKKIKKLERKYLSKIVIAQPLTKTIKPFNINEEVWVCNVKGELGLLIGGDNSDKWILGNAKESFEFDEKKLEIYSNIVNDTILKLTENNYDKNPIHWWEILSQILDER